jgi:hypothetical protein
MMTFDGSTVRHGRGSLPSKFEIRLTDLINT